MIIVILFFVVGFVGGYSLRKYRPFGEIIDKVVEVYIYFFLFLLGVSIGLNDEVMRGIERLGFNAAVISIAGMVGSAMVSLFVYKYFFEGKIDEE